MTASAIVHPIERLEKHPLGKGWSVGERQHRDPGGSGMSRCVCYVANHEDGRKAFLKTFDFRTIEQHDIDLLNRMTQEYVHERDIHKLCNDEGIGRVTKFYGAGSILVEGTMIHYILSEYAKDGSIRAVRPPGDTNVRLGDRLRAHRDVAAALQQLHNAEIAHQDIKPSNAVHIGGKQTKLIDLGSASSTRLKSPPHDLDFYAGQPSYAPYELLYGESGSFYVRRIGCDIFLLGNLIFTDIVGISLSHLALHCLKPSLRPMQFTGQYRDVMPDLMEIHAEILQDSLVAQECPEHIVKEIAALIAALCHPDPSRRGHPRNAVVNGQQFGLERVISTLDRLAIRADLGR